MVAAWPFICSPRSDWFLSISLRRSGGASKTTPLPKIGVMNGYASAWSSTSSGARKNGSFASAPLTRTTSRSTSRNRPTSPHSSRTRCSRAMGSVRSSCRCPCGSSGCSRERLPWITSSSSIGASGVTSTRFRCTPRGAETTVTMASAMACGLRKCGCRARPNRTQWLSTSAASWSSQPVPISLHVGPGRTIEARTPVPSSSICSACAIPSRPHFPAAYADMNGRARTATSDDTKSTSPRFRSTIPGTTARTSRWAPSRLTSTSRPKRSVSVSWMTPGATRPALETSTSMSPSASVAAFTNASTDDPSATSSEWANASPPVSLMTVATFSHRSARRAPSATGNPAAARAVAVAAPMPDEAPVTITGRRSGCAYLPISAPPP